MEQLVKIKDLVQDAVNKGATSIEQIHKIIANLPFEMLEKINLTSPTSEKVQKLHDRTIGTIYDTIRSLNNKVAEIATELLEKVK